MDINRINMVFEGLNTIGNQYNGTALMNKMFVDNSPVITVDDISTEIEKIFKAVYDLHLPELCLPCEIPKQMPISALQK